jgi:hypothetical protein
MQHLAKCTTASESHPFVHLCFALAFGLSAYNFFRAVTLDAGTCPKPSSDDELKTVSKGVSSTQPLIIMISLDYREPNLGRTLERADFLCPMHGE